MLKIHLPPDVRARITTACRRAGIRETGGMLFGEHVAEGEFRVVEATVAGLGSFAKFLRRVADGLADLERFFHRTKRDYVRFNYLGEWHSHPSFALHPSGPDDAAMFEIVGDPATGARFAISMIVKLSDIGLDARAFVYFPIGERHDCDLTFEN
jgi:[CysO sulfur-carrier protein]-S-L-cysteine hydrolase